MNNLELLKEIEAWLCFNTDPSKEELAKMKKTIKEHIEIKEKKYTTIEIENAFDTSQSISDFLCWYAGFELNPELSSETKALLDGARRKLRDLNIQLKKELNLK